MREIKFKVWDNVNYLSQPFTLQDIQSGKVQFTSDCIVIQFTGVIDKNGKEIYESDVVKRTKTVFDFNKSDDLDTTYEDELSFIEYRENGFWVHDEGFGYEGEDLWNWEEMEVIGNLFENPELYKIHVLTPEELEKIRAANMKFISQIKPLDTRQINSFLPNSEQEAQGSDTTKAETTSKS